MEVDVLERLSLAAEPVRVDLVAGASTQISVRVSRIEGSEVTVEIAASTGLRVEPTSVTLTDRAVPGVTTVTAGADYSGTATVTFEAVGYESTLVSVTITRAPTPELGQINLGVAPPALEIVTGESTPISITVSTTATITITGGGSTASVPAAVVPFTVGKDQSTTINVFGVRSGTTTLTIEAVAAGYETTRTTVEVEVLEHLSLAAEPVRVDLVAGASTEIRVRVSRIEGSEVTVEIAASTGLRVEPTSVTLTDRAVLGVTTVTADVDYSGTATVTFEAVGYESTLVSVTITRAPTPELGQINLGVAPPAVEIVTGASTPISISVSTTATITITGGGSTASVPAAVVPFTVGKDQSTTINVFGVRSGTTTLTIEAVAAGYETTRATVEVNVIESLRIAAEPVRVDLVQGASTQISVRVSRIEGSEVTVEIAASTGLRVEPTSVTLTDRAVPGVTTVTAGADYSGTATVTFEAVGYESTTVAVNVDMVEEPTLPQVELSAMPSALEIVTGESTNLTITAGATTATITITGGGSTASVPAAVVPFTVGKDQSTTINVFGDMSGTTTLTIEAVAAGYETTRTTVEVEVLERLSLAAEPVRVDLVAGVSTEIRVRVSRIEGSEVTVEIAASTGLRVEPTSVTLTDRAVPGVTTVTADVDYSGTATVTFEAVGYESTLVSVTITRAPTPELGQINLSVIPPAVEIVTGESTPLSISVSTTATITITGGGSTASVPAAVVPFTVGKDQSTTINVFGDMSGTTTLTITATAVGYTDTTVSVAVEVVESLQIFATPASVDLVAGASRQISVRVSRIEGSEVTVEIAASTGLRVEPTSVTLTDRAVPGVTTVTADVDYSGTATVTFTAPDGYASAMVAVNVDMVEEPTLLAVELSVMPSVLEIVTGESAELMLTATPTATITISSDSTEIASVTEATFELQEGVERTIDVSGGNVDTTTLTITATAVGRTDTTVSVRVEVVESLQIFARPASVDLVAGASTEINVRVSRLIGESVTVDIAATTGLSVASSVLLTNLNEVVVSVTATESYAGTATVTFTAPDGYASAMVAVNVDMVEEPTLLAVELSVMPSVLEIVTGESAKLMLTATPTATITISSDSTEIASVADAEFELQEGVETAINVSGGNVDTTTLTITATAVGRTDTTVSVRVEVVESLQIFATPASVDLVAGTSTQINVRVSRLVGESVTVDIEATTGLSVASSVLLTDLNEVAVTVTATESYDGTATVTFTAPDGYASATVAVDVDMVEEPTLLAVELSVMPSALEIVTGESAKLMLTATPMATITIMSDSTEIASVADAEFELQEGVETAINVSGGNVDTTTLTITATAVGRTDTTVSVRVEVVESLQIFAMPPSVDLVAGTSTQINVRVSRLIGESVTVDIAATTGLSVASSVLLTDLREVAVTVTATESYAGTATVTFTAATDGYESATVAVNVDMVEEPTLLAVELSVMPSALEIVTGESAKLMLTATPMATITIRSDSTGIASVADAEFELQEGVETAINVSGGNVGDTTLTITARAVGYTDTTVSVDVNVIERLQIFARPVSVDLVAGSNTQINVRVSRLIGESVTVDIAATTGLSVASSVLLTNLNEVVVSVTATESYAGTATVTFTAPDGYASAMVAVNVDMVEEPTLLAVELSVMPSVLEIVTGESAKLMLTATPTATITISSDSTEIASVAESEYELQEGVERTINVSGGNVDTTTLTITARAVGRTETTVSVRVEVVESLEIFARPASVDLVAGSSTEINVRVSRLLGESVTVDIAATTGLSVASSVLLTNLNEVVVSVTATESYAGTATVTFTAPDGYASAMVAVNVDMVEEPTLLAVELSVMPSVLEIVTGESAKLMLTATPTATITISSDSTEIASVAESEYELQEGVERTINVSGGNVDTTTLTITARAVGRTETTVSVRVEVVESLEIFARPASVDLVAGSSTEINVRVSRLLGESVTVEIAASTGLRVEPTSVTLTDRAVPGVTTVTADVDYSGTATVTFEAVGYESTTVAVNVDMVEEPTLPQVELSAMPSALEIVTGESAELTITATPTAMITISSDSTEIASVAESAAPFLLAGGAGNSTRINVSGGNVDTTTLTITATADGYTTARASVSVEVLAPLFIAVSATTIALTEGENIQISVNPNLIRDDVTTVTISIEATTGLTVIPSSLELEFTDTLAQIVTVTATEDDDYTGDRTATLTLTATDYTTATVTVNITDNDPQLIGLEVTSSPDLDLVRFSTADITVRVDVEATLNVETEGSVILAASSTTSGSFNLNAGEETQIQILGYSVGEGTVTFTVGGGETADTAVVTVMVSTPALVISDVSEFAINLVARTTTGLTVRVSAEAGVPEGVTLTATVSDEAGRVVSVNPTERVIERVSGDTLAMFTVEGLDAGDATLRLTASHPEYKPTSIDVSVSVYLPGVELSVSPPSLRFEQEATESLRVEVRASTEATIRIRSGNDDIARVSSQPFTLMGGPTNNSTMIEVSGVGIGRTTLAITASADGYATEEVVVIVEVQNRFRIAATPVSLSLVEGDSTGKEISVSLNRIPEGSDTVTVTINLQEGSELTVSASSLRFTATELQTTVRVTAIDDNDMYMENRSEMLTLTADDYTTATVTVNITDDDPQPIELEVRSSTDLDLVRFASTEITVSVDVATDLTVKAEGAVRLAGGRTSVSSTIGVEETQIQIEAVSVGKGTVTFTVGEGRTADTAVVTVTVIKPTLMISASGVDELEIEARTTEGLTVTVNVAAGDTDTDNVTVTTTVMGNTDAVSVESPVGVSVGAPTMLRVTGLDAGTATLRLTASHQDYKSTSIDVSVSVYLPPVGLSASTELEITIGTTEALMIRVNAEGATQATLTTSVRMSTIISVTAPATPESLTGGDTIINVTGDNQGETDLVIQVEADGYEAAEITVRVRVIPVAALRFRIKVFLEGAQ